jgi:hypothetical protein
MKSRMSELFPSVVQSEQALEDQLVAQLIG